jgi:hypothetical protein
MGDAIAAGMPPVYNGLHLRLEKDANYVRRVGGVEVRIRLAVKNLEGWLQCCG